MEIMFDNSELVEFRLNLNKEVAELPHLKDNNWHPEKVDYDAVKPKTLNEIAYKIWEKTDRSKDYQSFLPEAEEVWQMIRYGFY